MVRCVLAVLGLVLLAALPLGLASTPAAAGSLRQVETNGSMVDLQVTVNKAETLSADQDFSEVLVGNPEIADVVALTSPSLYVLGKKIGMTGISLLSADKRVMAVINVEVTYDIAGLKARIVSTYPAATSTSAPSTARSCSPGRYATWSCSRA